MYLPRFIPECKAGALAATVHKGGGSPGEEAGDVVVRPGGGGGGGVLLIYRDKVDTSNCRKQERNPD